MNEPKPAAKHGPGYVDLDQINADTLAALIIAEADGRSVCTVADIAQVEAEKLAEGKG